MSVAKKALCALGALALLTAPAQAQNAVKPQRIVSMNQCTDLLLLQLAPKSRIASISFLAHDAAWAIAPGLDAGVPINHGAVEDLIAAKPDLILTGPYGATAVRLMAKRINIPVVEIEEANDFGQIRAVVRKMGAAVGEPERAEALLAAMDAKLATLAARRPAYTVTVAAWSGGDYVSGRGTLTNTIIETAGAVNIAAKLPDARTSTFGIEELLAARPDALLYAGGRREKPSLRTAQTQLNVLRDTYRDRMLDYPSPLYACGLPQAAQAATDLRAALAGITPLRPWR
jgi:iron complex transport system substrate-binding protein